MSGTAGIAIGAYGVTFGYGSGAPVLDGISFEIERNRVVALLGANGSGKSTLLRILSGLHTLGTGGGLVKIRDQDLNGYTTLQRASRVVYVGADLRADFPVTAFEGVALGGTPRGRRAFGRLSSEEEDRIEWAMNECLCWNLRNREIATLSGGERQLVHLARALVQGAKVLLLDESISKMDLNHQARMGAWFSGLKESGYTVVLVAHDWNLACEWADQALVLHRGGILKNGPVREVVNAETLRVLYPDAKLSVGEHPTRRTPKVFFSG